MSPGVVGDKKSDLRLQWAAMRRNPVRENLLSSQSKFEFVVVCEDEWSFFVRCVVNKCACACACVCDFLLFCCFFFLFLYFSSFFF
jgi:hypothetical protein